MRSIHTISNGVIAQLVRRQPPSGARTAFAWQLVVGPALARVTSVEMQGTTLSVRSDDQRWLKEIDRAKSIILPRMQQLLGETAVAKISVHRLDCP